MLPVVIVYRATRRETAERLERRLRALGFEVLLQAAEQPLPDDYLAVIAINAAELPQRALPDDVVEFTVGKDDYDFVVRELVKRLYARLPQGIAAQHEPAR
jgi:hypothetical protein